jgi:putative acetyltransferase
MALQEGVPLVTAQEFPRIVEVWEAAVRATHHFITEEDIEFFRPRVRAALPHWLEKSHLACVRDAAGTAVGFVGTRKGNVDMLFIHPDWRGMGIGRRLLQYAVEELGATTLDVNEQNDQAVGFYRRMGFEVTGRSERDGTGKPYPILHMRLHERDRIVKRESEP